MEMRNILPVLHSKAHTSRTSKDARASKLANRAARTNIIASLDRASVY